MSNLTLTWFTIATVVALSWYAIPALIDWTMPKPEKFMTPGWKAIDVLLRLTERIQNGKYDESRLVAWLEYSHSSDPVVMILENEHGGWQIAIDGAAREMQGKGWNEQHIQRFRRLIAAPTKASLDLLDS